MMSRIGYSQIKPVRGKILGQRIQQSRMARRIGRTEIIDRIDNAAPDEMEPDPVHLGPREVAVQ
jgi:hypothetical protein